MPVISVEERTETLRGRKDADGNAVLETRSLGWFIRISDSSAIGVGMEKPDVAVGDEIVLLLVKKGKQDGEGGKGNG